MKKRLREFGWWFEDKLKSLCGEITPDKRITVIVIMLLIFTLGNLYFTISTIYNWGKESERRKQIKIEHMRQLELPESLDDGGMYSADTIYEYNNTEDYE